MKDPFSFYDIVAHVIPGAVGLAIIYWIYYILTGQSVLSPSLQKDVFDLGGSILILVASYLLGTVAQAIGEGIEWPLLERIWKWERKEAEKDRNNPMMYLLCEPQERFQFTQEFQTNLRLSILEVFHLDLRYPCDAKNLGTTIKAHGLCYSLIMQENAAQRSERIKAIFRLFRGTFVILLAALIGLITLLRINIPTVDGMDPLLHLLHPADTIQPLIGSFIVLFVATGLTLWAFSFFSKLFPVTVYEDFYAWFGRKKSWESTSSAPEAVQED
jgi:hypothetical protein